MATKLTIPEWIGWNLTNRAFLDYSEPDGGAAVS